MHAVALVAVTHLCELFSVTSDAPGVQTCCGWVLDAQLGVLNLERFVGLAVQLDCACVTHPKSVKLETF